jgi:putative oxidoreductase
MNSKLLSLAVSFHAKYTSLVPHLQHPLLLIIRLYWGYDFYQTGLGKLNNLEGTTEFFASLNIPLPHLNAILVGSTELICGIFLMLGVGARYFTLPLMMILLVAFATDDREALMNIFSDPESFVAATPFLHLFAVVIIYTFGTGAFSLDAVLKLKNKKVN